MSRREAAQEETRRRIVEATARLHGEKGVLGTSWQDIAREADVSVTTVYSHFPSLDELLPACGALVMARARPPNRDAAAEIVGDARRRRERLRRVASELFAYYERGGPHLEVDVRERELPGFREWEESQRELVGHFVRVALAGDRPGARTVGAASAFFDLPTFKALRARGVGVERAAETVAQIVDCLVRGDSRSGRKRSGDDDRD
jgi:AcrR family transcriptional regulator